MKNHFFTNGYAGAEYFCDRVTETSDIRAWDWENYGMFTSPSRPFYQSVTIINLQPLSLQKYTEFAEDKFSVAGYQLDPSVIEVLYKRYDGVTSYIHRILNILFSRMEPGSTCTDDMIDSAEDFIVRLSSDTYESLFYQMPAKQRSIFLAIASECSAREVMGSAFIKRLYLHSGFRQFPHCLCCPPPYGCGCCR